MKRPLIQGLAAIAALALLAPLGSAQSNTISGLDVSLGFLDGLDDEGRTGTFPNGRNGFAMSTTSCNVGTVEALWQSPMDPDHPFICFIMTRESGGRMVQISNYSRVKHGFFALSSNQCNLGCAGTDGTRLGIGCSDTYGIGTNASRNYLGPPEEIDPWLGEWNRTCSLFDGPDCDNQRDYFGSEPNGVNGRVEVEDSDLDVAGANFYYYSLYVVEHEAESNRGNNHGWHQTNIAWNGSSYNVNPINSGTPNYGSVLDAWSGATVHSNTNGSADGRYYVASLTTPAGPNTHYEYAVHNRDNARAMDSFRVPIAPGTVVTNFGFHDVDQNAGNDWTASVIGNEVVFSTTTNPLMWNSIFNFWFDADSSPVVSGIALDQHFGGGGSSVVMVNGEVPGGGVIDPCAQADDGLEENDSCASATPLSSGFQGGLFVSKTDEDWYRVSTADGDTLTLTTSFSDAAGDLDIELFDACGQPFISNSDSTSDDEQVVVTNNTGSAQDYWLRVFVFAGDPSDCNNYNLTVDIQGIPPIGCGGADALEPNDSCGAAAPQGAAVLTNLTVQDTDDDWYAITLTPGQSLDATFAFLNSTADLDVELFSSCGGGLIDQSTSTSNAENVSTTNNTGGNITVFLRMFVWNDNAPCNTYDMTIAISGGDPCATLPADSFEQNDSCGAAATLGTSFNAGLNVSKTDPDWYEVVVPNNATIDVDAFFNGATADVDVFLFDACGGTELDSGETGSSNESMNWVNTTGGSVTAKVLVEVWVNSSGNCNDYDLDILVTPGAPTNLIPFCFGDGSGTNCPCGNNSTAGHGGGCANSGGNGLVLIASGNPSVSNDTLGFTTSNGVGGALAVLVSANNQLGMGNGILGMPPTDGLRCVGNGLLRHGNRQIQPNGAPSAPWGEGGFPAAGLIASAGFTAGQVRNFAVVYRDFETMVCMTGLNTSNAVEVTMVP